MKLSSLLFLGIAGAVGPSLVHGFDTHELENHITQLKKDAEVLSTANFAKDSEIAALHAKLEELNAGCGGDTGGWTPTVGDSWNYNLATPVKTNIDVDVFLIDMDYAQDTIDILHGKGKVVVCYISIGTVEDWRADKDEFPADAIGNDLEDWDGEAWLDINNKVVQDIMAARVLKAASMGCDGIEPDNMMVYAEIEYGVDAGVSVTKNEQIAYNKWFAETVQASGMKVALKNSVEIVEDLVDCFDFAVNESCNQYDECGIYTTTFLAQGKPVFNVEYVNNMDMCDYTNDLGMDTIIKNYNLKSHMCSCVDSSRAWRCGKVI